MGKALDKKLKDTKNSGILPEFLNKVVYQTEVCSFIDSFNIIRLLYFIYRRFN